MKKTVKYNYNMPERDDRVKIDDLNQNAEMIEYDIYQLDTIIQTKAPINAPQFTGKVLAPKVGTENGMHVYEQVITTSYVDEALEVENLDSNEENT